MTKMRFKPHWIPPECFRWSLKLRNRYIYQRQNICKTECRFVYVLIANQLFRLCT